ncbi:hypothetical protein [Kutzneria sp. CA-103260]|uniref:hypothetical protein n=1 Tax=Kutzneria sp. CA-103260 TaxID=2802641 RepID=UPI001BAB54A7|nr:hypothetical protein [Kutzneria sp. CA-103260]QUQ64308.1 hypothetical protein JJ691_20280 [Kutzneria sp. CA-103260]
MITKRFAVSVSIAAMLMSLPAVAGAAPARIEPSMVNLPQCQGGAAPGWFCAYSGPNLTGDDIGVYGCGNLPIPWLSAGSFDNNMLGTRPVIYFVDGRPPWRLPAGEQRGNIDWAAVAMITTC